MGVPPLRRAWSIGALSGLLPCGWLYAFVAVAAATGTPWMGALVMAAFWLGTLPLLAAFGMGIRRALPSVERKLPQWTAVLMVVAGLYVLWGRTRVIVPGLEAASLAGNPALELQHAQEAEPSCCSGGEEDSASNGPEQNTRSTQSTPGQPAPNASGLLGSER